MTEAGTRRRTIEYGITFLIYVLMLSFAFLAAKCKDAKAELAKQQQLERERR